MKKVLYTLSFLDKVGVSLVFFSFLYGAILEKYYLGIAVCLLGYALLFYYFFKDYKRKPLGIIALDTALVVLCTNWFSDPEIPLLLSGTVFAAALIDLLFFICLSFSNVEGFSKDDSVF